MTLFSALMSTSRLARRRAKGFVSGESVPWDADAFPYHTVRRSIDLASMVPDRHSGGLQPATFGKRSRRMLRRAVIIICAAGGLGLVLLSLAQAARRPRSIFPDRGRRNPNPAGPSRNAPPGGFRRWPGLPDSGTPTDSGSRAFAEVEHHGSAAHGHRFRRSAESLTPVDA